MQELFKIIWAYLKPHIVSILLFICIVCLCVYGRYFLQKEHEDFISRLNVYQSLRDEEVKKIVAATEEERSLHQENLRKYEETIDIIQKKYLEDVKKLDDAKAAQVKKIVDNFNEDSINAAKKISEMTGLKLVIPEKKNEK